MKKKPLEQPITKFKLAILVGCKQLTVPLVVEVPVEVHPELPLPGVRELAAPFLLAQPPLSARIAVLLPRVVGRLFKGEIAVELRTLTLHYQSYDYTQPVLVSLDATPTATPLVVISDGVKIWVALGCSKGSFLSPF